MLYIGRLTTNNVVKNKPRIPINWSNAQFWQDFAKILLHNFIDL